jgi:hypothetical protein
MNEVVKMKSIFEGRPRLLRDGFQESMDFFNSRYRDFFARGI